MENDDLMRAIAAAKASDRQQAQAILARVVLANPRSEEGWLWLGHCLSEPQKRLFCYQKVLTLNPQNEAASRALQSLSSNTPPVQQDAQPNQTPIQTESTNPSTAVPKGKSNSSGSFRYWLPVVATVLFLVFLCVLPLIYLLMTGKIRSLAASMLPLPTATRSPAAMFNPGTSPTSTRVFDTPPLSLTSTPYSFKPGDPTATPLGNDITDSNFIAGVAAFYAEDNEEAIRLMDAVIESNPDLAPPYRYRGLTYWSLGDCVSGLADEEKALSLNPEYAVAWANRGLMNECLGNEEQGLQDYQKALSLDPSLAFVHHNLGVYYYGLGDYETSLEEYSLSAAIDPTRAGAWDGMSEALGKMGRFEECIENATKAIEIKPDLKLAYTDRGYCHLALNHNDAAIADYQAFVDLDPTDVGAWNNLGLAQEQSGDPQGAVVSLSKALELDPSYYQANINRGNAYIDLKKYDEAVSDYNAALEFGDIPAAYSGRGKAYYDLKKYDNAKADFEKALSLYPNDVPAHCGLALVYYEFGRYQDALDSAETANQLSPNCGGRKLLEIQGRSYYALKDYDQALLYINRALNMGPYSLGFYYRGIILQAAGRNEEAIQDLEQFLSYAQTNGYKGEEIADAKARLAELQP